MVLPAIKSRWGRYLSLRSLEMYMFQLANCSVLPRNVSGVDATDLCNDYIYRWIILANKIDLKSVWVPPSALHPNGYTITRRRQLNKWLLKRILNTDCPPEKSTMRLDMVIPVYSAEKSSSWQVLTLGLALSDTRLLEIFTPPYIYSPISTWARKLSIPQLTRISNHSVKKGSPWHAQAHTQAREIEPPITTSHWGSAEIVTRIIIQESRIFSI